MKILVVGDFHGKIPAKLKKEILKKEFDFIVGVGDYAGIEEWSPYILYCFKLKDKSNRKSPKEFFGKKKFKQLLKKDFKAGEEVLLFLDNLGKPGFFVFGNGDDEWYNYPFDKKILQARKSRIRFLKRIKNLKEMTYDVKSFRGISFLGFGGYMDVVANYDKRKGQDLEKLKRVSKRIEKSRQKFGMLCKQMKTPSIFILHYPPRGIFDKISGKDNPYSGKSAGIEFFREGILKHKPIIAFCGHMHEYSGKKKLGETLVINPGAAVDGKGAIVEIDEKRGKVKNVRFLR